MNDANAWAGQNYLGMQNNSPHYTPETAGDILKVAISQAKQKKAKIQETLDSMPKLQDELANLDALIWRLEGKEVPE